MRLVGVSVCKSARNAIIQEAFEGFHTLLYNSIEKCYKNTDKEKSYKKTV